MFADIHCHMLYGVDDGPGTKEKMLSMVDSAYEDGVRVLCLTPHFNHAFYGDNNDAAYIAFGDLSEYVKEKYPEMSLFIGCEIFYHHGASTLLSEGKCRTLASTKYVLVDFLHDEDIYTIKQALNTLMSEGYIPILAHTERYVELHKNKNAIFDLKNSGVLFQVNAPSILGYNGHKLKKMSIFLLKKRLCDIISTDSHDLKERKTCMSECSAFVKRKFGAATERYLMYESAYDILSKNRKIPEV